VAGGGHSRARTFLGGLAAVTVLAGSVTGGGAADSGTLVATPGRPAVVTAAFPPAQAGRQESAGRRQPTHVELSVLGFTPPAEGGVQAVVGLQAEGGGTVRELGRFGIFPNEAFRAGSPAEAQRFVFRLPERAAEDAGGQARLSVGLVPYGGTGEGARLELGGVEIQRR
jgi:hypothetical protein